MIVDGFRVVPIVVLIGARQVGKTSLMESVEIKGEKNISQPVCSGISCKNHYLIKTKKLYIS